MLHAVLGSCRRLVHRLDAFTDLRVVPAQQRRMRTLIWNFYADLKAYRADPIGHSKAAVWRCARDSIVSFVAAPVSSRWIQFVGAPPRQQDRD